MMIEGIIAIIEGVVGLIAFKAFIKAGKHVWIGRAYAETAREIYLSMERNPESVIMYTPSRTNPTQEYVDKLVFKVLKMEITNGS